MSQRRVVITGGAGFVGSHLAEELLRRGDQVVVLDNFITGNPKNLEPLSKEYLKLLQTDVSNPIEVEGPVDLVLHFASPASPFDYLKYPIQTLKVGSLGTHNTLGLAKAKGATFLLASTSEVYGDPQVHPQTEDYWGHVNPIGPRGAYDEAKRFAEAMTMAYHRFHGVDTRIVRIFNTYGPRMRLNDGRVVPAFVSQVLERKPLSVFGDGSQTRSFCFVTDLVDGILRLADSGHHEPVNLGNPGEFTILELAEILCELAGVELKVEHQDLPQDDPKVRRPDITKARNLLGWEPKVPLREGLKTTLDWFAQVL
jgi:dTDP-glucose 4,6-dehydratase